MEVAWQRTGSPTWAVAEEKFGSSRVQWTKVPAGTTVPPCTATSVCCLRRIGAKYIRQMIAVWFMRKPLLKAGADRHGYAHVAGDNSARTTQPEQISDVRADSSVARHAQGTPGRFM